MSQVKLGDKNISFIHQGNELLYPNPIKDGLVAYYDFKGMKNKDTTKNIAKDLSNHNNNGTLQNFAYTNESGYNDGLRFDNVDDEITTDIFLGKSFTITLTIEIDLSVDTQFFIGFDQQAFYMRRNYNALHCSVYTDTQLSNTSGGNLLFYKMKQNNQNKVVITMSVDDSTKTLKLYGNDEKFSTVDTKKSITEVSLRRLGKWISGSTTNLAGKILSTKAYNRALTDEEVVYNYKLEKERWDL